MAASRLHCLLLGSIFRWREKKAKNDFPQSSSLIQRSASDSTRKHNVLFFGWSANFRKWEWNLLACFLVGFFSRKKGKQPTPACYNKSEWLPRELQCEWQLGGVTSEMPLDRNFSSDILRNFINPPKSQSVLLCVSTLRKSCTLYCFVPLD